MKFADWLKRMVCTVHYLIIKWEFSHINGTCCVVDSVWKPMYFAIEIDNSQNLPLKALRACPNNESLHNDTYKCK